MSFFARHTQLLLIKNTNDQSNHPTDILIKRKTEKTTIDFYNICCSPSFSTSVVSMQ